MGDGAHPASAFWADGSCDDLLVTGASCILGQGLGLLTDTHHLLISCLFLSGSSHSHKNGGEDNVPDLTYVAIRIPEGERKNVWGRAIYSELIHLLLGSRAPGMTVFRGFEGLDAKRHIQNSHSDYAQDSLPMTLEMITDVDSLDVMMTIKDLLHNHPHCVTTIPAIDMKSDTPARMEELQMSETVTLRVYMLETDSHRSLPLYHALVLAAKRSRLLWVNVQRGIEGFGTDHILRRSRFFHSDSPVVVEITGTAEDMTNFVTSNGALIQAASGPAIILQGTLVSGSA